jgi:hypothetical protein
MLYCTLLNCTALRLILNTHTNTTLLQERYFGQGLIRYIREPKNLFRTPDTSISLAAIDFTHPESTVRVRDPDSVSSL